MKTRCPNKNFIFEHETRREKKKKRLVKSQNLSHETKKKKKERKSLYAIKMYYNSINSIGIQCKIWLPINELNSIVPEKWIMRYPRIDECVCLFRSFFFRKKFLISFEASCVCYKSTINSNGIIKSTIHKRTPHRLMCVFLFYFFRSQKKKGKRRRSIKKN